uniref:hypothetical protein n=1 Tax=Bacillus sp. WP8 TaxID=756828 RepID=UPI001C92C07C
IGVMVGWANINELVKGSVEFVFMIWDVWKEVSEGGVFFNEERVVVMGKMSGREGCCAVLLKEIAFLRKCLEWWLNFWVLI